MSSYLATGFYTVFFAVGAYLAINREHITAALSSRASWQKLLFISVSILLLLKQSDLKYLSGMLSDYANGLGAFLVIALSMSVSKFRQLLSHAIPIWLGRISYSIYLVHVPILYVVTQTFGAAWSGLEISLSVILLSILGAELLARLIEFPSIVLGKRLTQRL